MVLCGSRLSVPAALLLSHVRFQNLFPALVPAPAPPPPLVPPVASGILPPAPRPSYVPQPLPPPPRALRDLSTVMPSSPLVNTDRAARRQRRSDTLGASNATVLSDAVAAAFLDIRQCVTIVATVDLGNGLRLPYVASATAEPVQDFPDEPSCGMVEYVAQYVGLAGCRSSGPSPGVGRCMVSSFKQVKQRSKWVMGPHGEVVRMDIPRNFKEMELDADAPLYYAACEREMASQRDCKSWTLVDIDSDAVQGRNIISCRWVYDLKTVVDAGVESLRGVDPHKARLVARGFEEVPGEDWFEKYFGVTRLVTVRTIMAMAAEHGWRLWAMDVETAYLQAELRDVVVYMYQPEGFVEPPPPGVRMLVCKLDKALYGLVQSAREWGITFSEWMRTWRYLEQHAFVRDSL